MINAIIPNIVDENSLLEKLYIQNITKKEFPIILNVEFGYDDVKIQVKQELIDGEEKVGIAIFSNTSKEEEFINLFFKNKSSLKKFINYLNDGLNNHLGND